MGLDEKADAYAEAMNELKLNEKMVQEMQDFEEQTYDMIRDAVAKKDFTQMYNLFEQRYNKYPVQMSRAEAFGKASDEGLITKDILAEAQTFYGNLWFYVGD